MENICIWYGVPSVEFYENGRLLHEFDCLNKAKIYTNKNKDKGYLTISYEAYDIKLEQYLSGEQLKSEFDERLNSNYNISFKTDVDRTFDIILSSQVLDCVGDMKFEQLIPLKNVKICNNIDVEANASGVVGFVKAFQFNIAEDGTVFKAINKPIMNNTNN